MLKNIEVNDKLLQEALNLSGNLTEERLIEVALKEYIKRHRQQKIMELFGTIDYDVDYDYKQQRQIP